jgi:hypothetical protein
VAPEIVSGLSSIMTAKTTTTKFNIFDTLAKITITTNLSNHTGGHVHTSDYACIYMVISNPIPNTFLRDV